MSESTHETVSFATFLEYRARHQQAAMVGPVPPDVVTTPPSEPEPGPIAVAAAMPPQSRV